MSYDPAAALPNSISQRYHPNATVLFIFSYGSKFIINGDRFQPHLNNQQEPVTSITRLYIISLPGQCHGQMHYDADGQTKSLIVLFQAQSAMWRLIS